VTAFSTTTKFHNPFQRVCAVSLGIDSQASLRNWHIDDRAFPGMIGCDRIVAENLGSIGNCNVRLGLKPEANS
jgi:hypothetical protein